MKNNNTPAKLGIKKYHVVRRSLRSVLLYWVFLTLFTLTLYTLINFHHLLLYHYLKLITIDFDEFTI